MSFLSFDTIVKEIIRICLFRSGVVSRGDGIANSRPVIVYVFHVLWNKTPLYPQNQNSKIP